jgi:hypothetical protein
MFIGRRNSPKKVGPDIEKKIEFVKLKPWSRTYHEKLFLSPSTWLHPMCCI